MWPCWNVARARLPVLRDFEEAGDLVIYDEFGQGIAEFAKRIDGKGLLGAVALGPIRGGAVVDALHEVGIRADGLLGRRGERLMREETRGRCGQASS
jgi:hypothetical protein